MNSAEFLPLSDVIMKVNEYGCSEAIVIEKYETKSGDIYITEVDSYYNLSNQHYSLIRST